MHAHVSLPAVALLTLRPARFHVKKHVRYQCKPGRTLVSLAETMLLGFVEVGFVSSLMVTTMVMVMPMTMAMAMAMTVVDDDDDGDDDVDSDGDSGSDDAADGDGDDGNDDDVFF